MTRDDLVKRLKDELRESVEEVQSREQSELSDQLTSCRGRLVLFGAGTWGRRSAVALRQAGIRPLAFCDNDVRRWGSIVVDLPVLSPAEAAARFGSNSLFAITIWNAAHSYKDTDLQLRALGCERVVPLSSLTWRFADDFLPFFCLDRPHKVYSELPVVLQGARLWEDSESRREYLEQVLWRARGSWEFSRPVDSGQYFTKDLFEIASNEVVVDCGAYEGDTLREFLSLSAGRFREFFAIEPDPQSFSRLSRYVSSLPFDIRARIRALQSAVGAVEGPIRFDAVGRPDSRESIDGAVTVPSAPLDNLLRKAMGITLLKMDIEGAEIEALEGARSTISRDRPILAVCVYHRQSDLWRAPAVMHAVAPDHALFLKRHRPDGWETVAYAIPRERVKRGTLR